MLIEIWSSELETKNKKLYQPSNDSVEELLEFREQIAFFADELKVIIIGIGLFYNVLFSLSWCDRYKMIYESTFSTSQLWGSFN